MPETSAVLRCLAPLAALLAGPAAAAVHARCIRGCEPVAEEAGVNLILRASAATGVTIAVESTDDPATLPGPAAVYAGNPSASIREWKKLAWRKEGEVWRDTLEVRGDELGSGTFLVVTIAQPPGKRQQILEWGVFRLLTVEERDRSRRPPPFGSSLSLQVTPGLLSATTGHGVLPPRRGETLAWWAFDALEGNTDDLDLDGEHTGIPGLAIQVANPWHARAGEEWKARVGEVLRGNGAGTERFEDLQWYEVKDRALRVEGVEVALRSYYTVVTLHTAASARRLGAQEAGDETPLLAYDHFSHETSAALHPPFNPVFWASYSEREHSRDPGLLGQLRAHLREGRPVPGLSDLQRVDGDGGQARYTAGFWVQVRPWTQGRFRAGIVAVDLVAARVGVGGASTIADEKARGAFCRVIGCGQQGGAAMNLQSPPSGYSLRGSPYAKLGTISGALELSTLPPVTAPKGGDEEEEPTSPEALRNLPDVARFGLSADLRAGLLTRDRWWGAPEELYPIDPYAQFVVQITVAMVPEAVMVTDETRIFPRQRELAAVFVKIQNPLSRLVDWIGSHSILSALLLLAVVAVAAPFLPALAPLVAAVARLLGAVARLLAALVGGVARLIDRARAKAEEKRKGGGGPAAGPGPGPAGR